MAAHQSKKLRRDAEDLLRRKGMMAMPETTAMPGGMAPVSTPTGMPAAGPTATPFAHHSASAKRSRGQSPLAAAHDLVPGHRHRGAEQHSALSGR
ncbi:hypothetical protein [Streptacidiphilus fuscans]|uniref:Uncharacterized protein n=1 Tax=Streptacidiphilus fuscans TaxID=2789292 RepID=A0A931FDA6_9ACTN|nr:hypothetical protein [Streptacidiphilus fuscans]MBF9069363.1 hypothetical protein [Streptacidiphilus fuscans]